MIKNISSNIIMNVLENVPKIIQQIRIKFVNLKTKKNAIYILIIFKMLILIV